MPPLRREVEQLVNPKTNSFLESGPFRLFLAVKDGRVAGRVMAHIDQKTNAVKGRKAGYISLFESIPDYRVAEALFESAAAFHREHGMTLLIGPVSPTNGDDYRGLLLNDFDRPPVLMNSYNPLITRSFLSVTVSRSNWTFTPISSTSTSPGPRRRWNTPGAATVIQSTPSTWQTWKTSYSISSGSWTRQCRRNGPT